MDTLNKSKKMTDLIILLQLATGRRLIEVLRITSTSPEAKEQKGYIVIDKVAKDKKGAISNIEVPLIHMSYADMRTAWEAVRETLTDEDKKKTNQALTNKYDARISKRMRELFNDKKSNVSLSPQNLRRFSLPRECQLGCERNQFCFGISIQKKDCLCFEVGRSSLQVSDSRFDSYELGPKRTDSMQWIKAFILSTVFDNFLLKPFVIFCFVLLMYFTQPKVEKADVSKVESSEGKQNVSHTNQVEVIKIVRRTAPASCWVTTRHHVGERLLPMLKRLRASFEDRKDEEAEILVTTTQSSTGEAERSQESSPCKGESKQTGSPAIPPKEQLKPRPHLEMNVSISKSANTDNESSAEATYDSDARGDTDAKASAQCATGETTGDVIGTEHDTELLVSPDAAELPVSPDAASIGLLPPEASDSVYHYDSERLVTALYPHSPDVSNRDRLAASWVPDSSSLATAIAASLCTAKQLEIKFSCTRALSHVTYLKHVNITTSDSLQLRRSPFSACVSSCPSFCFAEQLSCYNFRKFSHFESSSSQFYETCKLEE
eukprot:g20856.t1